MLQFRMLFLFALVFSIAAQAELTVFYNGKIATMDKTHPEANTLVVDNGRIIFVGDRAKAKKYFSQTPTRIDLKNQLVLPGFVESHAHFLGVGFNKVNLNVTGSTSAEMIAQAVKERVKELPKGEWLTGRGWDQNVWPVKEFPTHQLLSDAAPNNPVILRRIDGHAAWCNSLAMKLAGVDKSTKNPSGGKIVRDSEGNPTGVFIDQAAEMILSRVPKPSRELNQKAAQLAQKEAFRFGITSLHDAGINQDTIDVYDTLYAKKALKIRVYAMLDGSDEVLLDRYLAKGPRIGEYDNHFTVRSMKLYADGALGSRGASLLQPYRDEQSSRGLIITDEKKVANVARKALQSGFQVATHAIGDNANRLVLNAYEKAGKDSDVFSMARFRIEHAQIVDPLDLPRFAKLGVIASMQPTHCTSDSAWVPTRLGDARSKSSAYMWRNFLRAKTHLAFGSDAPVEEINPLLGLYAAVTRKDPNNPKASNAFYPKQTLTIYEALEAFTTGGSYAEFSEKQKGKLKEGYFADFIVLDKDILNEKPEAMLTTKVFQTYIAGEKVYEAIP